MARKIRLITTTGKTVTTDLYADDATVAAETAVAFTEVAPQIYEGTVTAAAGSYTLNLKYSGVLVGYDRCIVGATDPFTYSADSVKVNLSGTTVASVAELSAAQSEPGQGSPAVNASPLTKLAYLFKAWRNKKTQTSSQYSLYADDASTIDQKATVSDDGAGTTTINEVASGP